jgi:hypothetical protein
MREFVIVWKVDMRAISYCSCACVLPNIEKQIRTFLSASLPNFFPTSC